MSRVQQKTQWVRRLGVIVYFDMSYLLSYLFSECFLSQPLDSSDLSCSVRALQQDLDELKSVNESLRKENHSLREQLNTARNGN